MSRKMLIDAAHSEETRVVVVDGHRVEEFDFESATKRQIRGNIYLAKVTRVEPSLQAAFVEYGGNKHGFLAFNEIHPDYYQIPVEDRVALREAEAELSASSQADESDDDSIDEEELIEEAARKRRQLLRKYKIQEVIKRRQVLLVQVVKEERGNKGAALTTYLSLAGRYCVLMPNTPRGGGISRKITNAPDRKRLKEIAGNLEVPKGMGLIVRTAGAARTKTEIKRDYDYLLRLWETIREDTLKSMAPTLIYEEGNLVKRAIRDLYDKDVEVIQVEGDEAYKEAKAFIRMLMPSHAKKVQPYKASVPLYLSSGVENQLEAIYSPVAPLRSGGYLVINPTEALVSVDVNSGRSTKERNIEQTALRTNLEAAEEAARQMRLRDLAGLVVIDFIDMEENKNVRLVEKKMKDALKKDRARVQMGKISQFGLMEISRQRRRTSLVEGSTESCPHCEGLGHIRSIESSALLALRTLEEDAMHGRTAKVALKCPSDVALYLLNEKREHILDIENRFQIRIVIQADRDVIRPHCALERLESRNLEDAPKLDIPELIMPDPVIDDEEEDEEVAAPAAAQAKEDGEGDANRRRRRRRRRGGRPGDQEGRGQDEDQAFVASGEDEEASLDDGEDREEREERAEGEDGGEDRPRKRRRRGRRGGRGRRRQNDDQIEAQDGEAIASDEMSEEGDVESGDDHQDDIHDPLAVVRPSTYEDLSSSGTEGEDEEAREARRRRRPQRKPREAVAEHGAVETVTETSVEAITEAPAESVDTPEEAPAVVAEEDAPKPKRRRRKTSATPEAEASEAETAKVNAEEAPAPDAATEEDAPKPKRRRRTTKKAEAEATEGSAETVETPDAGAEEEAPKPKRRRRTTKKVEAETAEAAAEAANAPDASEEEAPKPKRRRRTTKKAEAEAPVEASAPEAPEVEVQPARVDSPAADAQPEVLASSETASPVTVDADASQAVEIETPAVSIPVAAPEATSEAEAPSEAQSDSDESDEDKGPKRKGWWQRSQKLFGLGN
ncbi:Rne/Rng family ribonuclease [Woodsholea maritima]|uniref:Rne/Rng family ribonuclease n=1 Tax=Woodsholea maritima TaxID=240237 RepID=UPI00035F6F21|nr:ribonuclease E/G [Woodsholea maritima]